MAVSGRKVPGFKDSLSIGSTEEFDNSCDPCEFLGQTVEAKGFCVNCQENLCLRCVNAHKSTKASRDHNLLDQPQKVTGGTTASSDNSKVCTEYCNIHKEVIKFYCSQHDRVGCSDCMTLDHRTCNIDYIPDVCTGIWKSKEFSGTLENVSKTLNVAETVEQKAQSRKTEDKTSVEEVIKEIETFQKKMNDRIEHLKQQLVNELDLHWSKQDQEVENIATSCARVHSELKQVQTALTECQTKQLDAQAFVTMKQAQSILKSTNLKSYEEDLNKCMINISYKPNNELENVLSLTRGLGKINVAFSNVVAKENKPTVGISIDGGVTQKIKTLIPSIKQKSAITVRTMWDIYNCRITGCAVISAGRLLLADRRDTKLKVVNTDTHSVVEEMTVDSAPFDVTVLPEDQAAVTLPDKKEILIVETAEKLAVLRSMKVDRRGLGIDYHQNNLYIVCQEHSLLVLDKLGNVLRHIPLQTEHSKNFMEPSYISIGKDSQTLYISDVKSEFVACLTLQGNVTGVYRHNELKKPRGLVELEDGSLLVCCTTSGTIHHISADLNQGHTLIRHVPYAWSICRLICNRQIYIGAESNKLSVFSYELESEI